MRADVSNFAYNVHGWSESRTRPSPLDKPRANERRGWKQACLRVCVCAAGVGVIDRSARRRGLFTRGLAS